ncbi:MAG TPA: GNAT family N-acetyltransferase [Acidimicrobiales bacterium]|nr:GNAT family N-acetyltransferase [Acidimicrobiales bacterium]
MIEVEIATSVDDGLVAALNALVAQLSTSAPPLTREFVREIVDSPATTLYVARDGDRVVGTLTLALFPIPTGVRAWIEDVVVDEGARGRGVGEALTRRALEDAGRAGARTVDLTSRPSREPANALYQRVGFVARDTNVYRFFVVSQGLEQ